MDWGFLHASKRTLASHWIDGVIAISFWVSAAICHWVYGHHPFDRFFVERDPSLSHPWEKGLENGEEVPTTVLIALALPITMICLLFVQLIATKLFQTTSRQKSELHPKALKIIVLQLAFLEALGLTVFATEFLKPFAGRKRPNFFALCNYKGYRDALATNNFTEYFNLTTPGVPGSLSYCRATQAEILESQFSFPSGHSSTIWCAMTFVGYYAVYIVHHYSGKHNMVKGLIALFFISTAVLVSVTRPRDYWHNFDDILAGALLGFACSTFIFALNYSPLVATLYKRATESEDFNEEEASVLVDYSPASSSKLSDGQRNFGEDQFTYSHA